MPTIEETIALIQNSILGKRRGIDTPMYVHSVRVYEFLKTHGFDEDVQYAGLLHDIVEDGDHSFDQLKDLGYSERTLELVDLTTFDLEMGENIDSWFKLIERLIQRDDKDAWAVKLADMYDNLTECHHCSREVYQGYIFKKAPVFIYYGNKHFGGTDFYNEFIEVYREQLRRYWKYFQE